MTSISRVICTAATLLVLAIGFWTSADSDDILKKRPSIETQTSSPVNYLVLLLQKSGGWGGIEDYESGCSGEPESQMPVLDGTLGDGLVRIHQLEKSLKWQIIGDGLVVVKGNPAHSILNSRLGQFTFNAYDPPDKITSALLSSDPVASSIARQGFSVGSPELGFAQARVESEKKITLNGITLREVLNSIARSSHPRVWLFKQQICGGRKEITINWVVK
jgi:hypothetical protein